MSIADESRRSDRTQMRDEASGLGNVSVGKNRRDFIALPLINTFLYLLIGFWKQSHNL